MKVFNVIVGTVNILSFVFLFRPNLIERIKKMGDYELGLFCIFVISLGYLLYLFVAFLFKYQRFQKRTLDSFENLRKSLNADSKLRTLSINSAQYGARGQTNNVTHIIRSRVVSGRIEKFQVLNEALDSVGQRDPALGIRKVLIVEYIYCGETRNIQIPEGEILSIP